MKALLLKWMMTLQASQRAPGGVRCFCNAGQKEKEKKLAPNPKKVDDKAVLILHRTSSQCVPSSQNVCAGSQLQLANVSLP